MSIQGKIVVLDDLQENHLEMMVKWRNDPEVSKFMFDRGIFTIEKQKEWYKKIIDDKSRKQFIILEKKSMQPIGALNLMDIDYENSHADWGYYIGEPQFRMGGYSVEAELLMLEYAFGTLGLNKIYCQTLSNNMKVVSIHKKFGFNIDGVLRKHYRLGNEFLDVYIMSLFREEFKQKKPEIEKLLSVFTR